MLDLLPLKYNIRYKFFADEGLTKILGQQKIDHLHIERVPDIMDKIAYSRHSFNNRLHDRRKYYD